VAITTNGVLMKSGVAEQILGNTKWIKVSCNAGTADTYGKIHRTKAGDFDKVIDNLRHYVLIRKKHCFTCTLGIQLLLLPENEKEVEELAVIAREIGLDYLVVKPYTHHYRNRHKFKMQYQQFTYLETNLQKYATDTFSIIFRANTMRKWDEQQRDYDRCLSLPFWSYIDAGGNVWGCSAHLQDERFLYGNINEQKFQEIWEGEKRQESLQWVEAQLDISTCKLNCRMDEVNRYLWDLVNPPEHVNFI
ncbi:MAG: SPASM domain-containing protein, partial [Desulfobulbaceae bacterium]|nr:SPASM domain-containing protein [Desulfobulbaceae bacterium]